MRENAAAKAVRLLGSGRVVIRTITDDTVTGTVRGDTARIYSVTFDPGGWRDDCDAIGKCSHIRAVQLCTLEPLTKEDR